MEKQKNSGGRPRRIAEILLRRPKRTAAERDKIRRENPVYRDCYGSRISTRQGGR